MVRTVAGRPRAKARIDDGRSPREQILDAAAELFARKGYAATSTRDIAEAAGIRQATLYYHVEGKSQLLCELLDASVRPTLDGLDALREIEDPAAALHALVLRDVHTLTSPPHNLAVLYLAPELDAPEFESIRAARSQLREAYQELAARIDDSDDAEFRGAACLQLVEIAIEMRQRGGVPEGTAEHIAAACLRVAGAGPADIERVTA